MMKYAIAALLVLASISVASSAIKPEVKAPSPWNRVEVTGLIRDVNAMVLFGNGDKKLWIEWFDELGYNHCVTLGFASKADYDEALRNAGQVVKIDAYSVKSDGEEWLVPITIQLKTK